MQLTRPWVLRRDGLILHKLRQALRLVEHRRINVVQLGLRVAGSVSPAHPGEVDAGVVGAKHAESSPHANVKRLPSDLAGPPVHPKGTSRQRARPFPLDHDKAVADYTDRVPQVVVLGALRVEDIPQQGEFVSKARPEKPAKSKTITTPQRQRNKKSPTLGPSLQLTLPVEPLGHGGPKPLHSRMELTDLRPELGHHLLGLVLPGRLEVQVLPSLLPLVLDALGGFLKGFMFPFQPHELLGIKAGLLSSGLELLAIEASLIDDGLELVLRPPRVLPRRLLAPLQVVDDLLGGGNLRGQLPGPLPLRREAFLEPPLKPEEIGLPPAALLEGLQDNLYSVTERQEENNRQE
ncbi:ice-structuring glycoprotein-like [Panicum miliaceum]|uniref:Ice-structuring glycoprotein-like n=1 Tax=Panicum miliaceum TaxID=4540 RepID=A0A3L6Q4E9_PANMI|nr:ice-structuring glycoprotein-like [Panicum miliaceum]